MPASKQFTFSVGHAGLALESRVADLRVRLDLVPPALLAERTGASYLEVGQGRGEFHFAFLGDPTILTYPDFRALKADGESLSVMKQALLMYYFIASDGTAPSGIWISFADLPDGRVYASAFQGYTGDAVVKIFGLNLQSFRSACEIIGGSRVALGDAAYSFQALPRLRLSVVFHVGDDDFSSICKILFDKNTAHCLPTEGCAILGNMLAQRLLRQK